MPSTPPVLMPRPQTKVIGGITFDDPYAHLHHDTEEVLAWQWAEADAARDAVRGLPHFAELVKECGEEFQSPMPSLPAKRAGRWFTTRLSAQGLGHDLVFSTTRNGEAQVFCAAQALGGTQDAPAYVWRCTPSPDGRWAVATVMPGGSLQTQTVVVRVADGFVDPLRLEALLFLGFGEPCWLPDSSGFVIGDRSPEQWHRVRQVFVHNDACRVQDHVFPLDMVSQDFPVLTHHVSPSGRFCIGVSAPHERTARVVGDLQTGQWRRFVPEGFHGECHGDWASDELFVAITTDTDSRGSVWAIPVADSQNRSAWRKLLPAADGVLRTLWVRHGRIVLADLQDVAFRLRVLSLAGDDLWTAALPPFGASAMVFPPRVAPQSDEVLVVRTGFAEMQTLFHVDVERLALTVATPPKRTMAGVRVEQYFATSRDGTQVPYFVVRRADLATGQPAATMLRAYGGFNLAFIPTYLGEVAPFVRCGGVYVHANLRGGAEYGATWHEDGRLHKKQNSFDDCYAVAEDLIRRGFTTPQQLAMQGASNGGLLSAVAAVQRPDLFCAAVPQAPLLDMMEPVRPGAGEDAERVRAVFKEGYGDPSDPADAAVLFAYSPYHNIKPGVAYPALFQILGEYDLGCPPYHGRKFTARLRAASTSGKPVLLRVWRKGGHGGSSDPADSATLNAEMMAFVFQQTGLEFVPK